MSNLLDLKKIKSDISFKAILEHYDIPFDNTKNNQKVSCPFHGEGSPSCGIDFERNIFNCFGCGAKGNNLDFICKMENDMPINHAAKKALSIANLQLESYKLASPQKPKKASVSAKKAKDGAEYPKEEKTTVEGLETSSVNKPLSFSLTLEHEHPFLKSRGISAGIAKSFDIGYNEHRGIMKGRICVPIHDTAGNLIAYAGRHPSDSVPENVTRYRFPSNFHKSSVLWNIHRLDDCMHIIIVEGFCGAIHLYRHGFPAVALMGTNISDEQINILKEKTALITLLFDVDKAGQEASKKALEKLSPFFWIRNIQLPENMQPDNIDPEELKTLFKKQSPQ